MEDLVQTYLNEISRYRILSPKEIKKRCLDIKKDPKNEKIYLDEIIQSHLRLVIRIAKNYVNKGLDFLDLIQEGNISLIKSIKRFNPELGFKSSTYLWENIKGEIINAIKDKAKIIKVPGKISEKIYKMKKNEEILSDKLGKDPNEYEVAKSMKISIEKLRKIREIDQQEPISLNISTGDCYDDKNLTLESCIEYGNACTPFYFTLYANRSEAIEEALESLSEREAQIIRMCFGFNGGKEYTYREIGQYLKINNQRISIMKKRALKKLKNSLISEKLKSYLEEKSELRAFYENTRKNLEEKLDELKITIDQLIKCVNVIYNDGYNAEKIGKIFEDFTEILSPYIKEGINIKNLFENKISEFTLKNPYPKKFTNRQLEIAKRISLGWDNEKISEDLFISKNTVRSHIKNLYNILEINDGNYLTRRMNLKKKMDEYGL